MVANLTMNLQKYIFTTQGRLNRLRYVIYQLAWALGIGIVGGIIGFIVGKIFGAESFAADVVTAGMSLIGLAGNVAIVIRRLHDLNRPEWWAVGIFIPLVNIVLALYLLFAPGTVGRNQYGEDPLR